MFWLIAAIYLQLGAGLVSAADIQSTNQGAKPTFAKDLFASDLFASDQGSLIAHAMAGSWEYGVYLLGLPVGLKARVEVQWDGRQVKATSQVQHFLAANNHQSVFSFPTATTAYKVIKTVALVPVGVLMMQWYLIGWKRRSVIKG